MIPRYTREEIGAVWTQQRRMESWLQVELAVPRAEDERPPLGLRVPQHRLGLQGGPHGDGAVGQMGDLHALLVLLGAGRAVPLDLRDVEGVQLVPLPFLARLDVLGLSPDLVVPCLGHAAGASS